MYAARNESRAEVWDKVAYSRLAGANSAVELDAKLVAMTAELRRIAFSIKKRKGWLSSLHPLVRPLSPSSPSSS